VGGGGDRQELGDPLNDPEDDYCNPIRHRHSIGLTPTLDKIPNSNISFQIYIKKYIIDLLPNQNKTCQQER
jgi:hypothetical protein